MPSLPAHAALPPGFRLCWAAVFLLAAAGLARPACAQTLTQAQQILAAQSAAPTQDQNAIPTGTNAARDSIQTVTPAASQPFQPTSLGPVASPLMLDQLVLGQQGPLDRSARLKGSAAPSEFEDYVTRVIGRRLPRFGQDLVLPAQRDFAAPATASVPADYRLNVGDTVVISLTGSVDGSVEREIGTNGTIFLPNVGAIRLAGVRYGSARDTISAAIGTLYRDYNVDVSIKKLRGIRVYVTGFANNPGAFTVSSLSTLANAVFQAGGPTAGGSFRSVKLYRNGSEVVDFDLYDLIRRGSRINDAILQNEDVLFIPPAGEQIAVIGSVQDEAIYEAKPGETLQQALAVAGGANALGDADRLILYRSKNAEDMGPFEIGRDQLASGMVLGGDILQVLSKGSLIQPVARQGVLVRVEGEVNKPGNFYVAPSTPMAQVMEMAGGLTPRAFPFGTKLVRASVRAQQAEGYADAISQLELAIASAPLTSNSLQNESARAAQLQGAREILQRLRSKGPDGRVVLDIAPQADVVTPGLLIENNDSILVPPVPTTVGVFGAVYRASSFLLADRPLRVKDYVDRAGGPIPAADKHNIFVVRANGAVLSRKNGAWSAQALPGDVIFVPVKTNSTDFFARLLQLTTIVFQLGLTAAVVANISQ